MPSSGVTTVNWVARSRTLASMPGPSGDVWTTTKIAAGMFAGNLFRSVRTALMPPADAPTTMTLVAGTLNAFTLPLNTHDHCEIKFAIGSERRSDAVVQDGPASYGNGAAMVDE